jgi:hypothetical protein
MVDGSGRFVPRVPGPRHLFINYCVQRWVPAPPGVFLPGIRYIPGTAGDTS